VQRDDNIFCFPAIVINVSISANEERKLPSNAQLYDEDAAKCATIEPFGDKSRRNVYFREIIQCFCLF